MQAIWEVAPWLFTMVILVGCSAFFSASEAALFSLRVADRRHMESGSRAQRTAERLLRDPDRLLFAVLFWNLVVNIVYFAIATMVAARLESNATLSVAFGVGSLLTIIFFSEMLPKSLAVVRARSLSEMVSMPLAVAIRMVDPIMPSLQAVNLISRRLIWPELEEQPYLDITDIDRAIELSTGDSDHLGPEKTVLRNLVQLSDLQVQEWMRPRRQFRAFDAPVSIRDLEGDLPPSGYLLVTESDGEEIASALNLNELHEMEQDHLEFAAEKVTYVPWCATVADTLQQMHRDDCEVSAVVNELGETIGIVTLTDMFDAILSEQPERSERLLNREAIVPIAPGIWQVAGMTNVRRLERQFGMELPDNQSITIAGVVQEELDGHPVPGDRCRWGPFDMEVLGIDEDGELALRLEWKDSDGN